MSMTTKVILFLGILAVAIGDGYSAFLGINAGDYSQVAINAALSFLFFHLAAMALKIGFLPWRVVPSFYLISGFSAANAFDYALAGQWLNVIGQAVVCGIWAIAAHKANKTRLFLKAEQE